MSQQTSARSTIASKEAPQPMGGCLVRLAWLIAGPIALFGLGASIARDPDGPWTLKSALFWAIVGLAVGARYVDVAWLAGETTDGKPASLKDWHRYTLLLVGVALAGWVVAAWIA